MPQQASAAAVALSTAAVLSPVANSLSLPSLLKPFLDLHRRQFQKTQQARRDALAQHLSESYERLVNGNVLLDDPRIEVESGVMDVPHPTRRGVLEELRKMERWRAR